MTGGTPTGETLEHSQPREEPEREAISEGGLQVRGRIKKPEEDCAESPKLETNDDRRKDHKTDDVYVPPYFDCLHITHDSYSVFST